MLEKVAEPLAAFAHTVGALEKYPHHLFTYAWKTLMQNHPHDSICGCSVDEVHREMVTRFEKSRHVAEAIVEDSTRALAEAVDTTNFAETGADALPVVVLIQQVGNVLALSLSRLMRFVCISVTVINSKKQAALLRKRI